MNKSKSSGAYGTQQQRNTYQGPEVHVEEDDDIFVDKRDNYQLSANRRGRNRRDNDEYDEEDDRLDVSQNENHRRNISGNIGGGTGIGGGTAGFRSKLKAPSNGGIGGMNKNAQTPAPESSKKPSMMSGLKNQVNSFKERLKNNKPKDPPMNPREAMRNNDAKKVIFGSMIETTGGDHGDQFMVKP